MTTAVLLGGVLTAAPATSTAAAVAAAPVDVTVLGNTSDAAAGSCWEIKQLRPTAPDGAYWLLTPKMVEPQRFFCDMTTDGGGWVLVGKGRENWRTDYLGQGAASSLLTSAPTTSVSTTVQLSSHTVDGLLNGGRVDALRDGVRLKRARNTTGTVWQEVRLPYTKKDRWSWTFGSEDPLSGFTFDATATKLPAITASFGTDSAYNRVINNTDKAHGYKLGFAYGAGVTGSTSSTSYLWSATEGGAGAEPFTDVYVRPRVTTYDAGFDPIANGGTSAVAQQRTLRNNALDTPWGVSTRTGSTANEYSVEVQALTQSGNTMFVGGNFSSVQKDAAGTGRVQQSYLAAFNVTTGDLVTTFKPVLNEQVRALETLPDGSVVAGGDFTSANGQPVTAVVALDPTTGATRSSFKATVENRLTGGTLRVRSLDVEGPWLYVGGALTHFAGGTRPTTFSYMRQLGRVSVTDGTPATNWNPNLSGTVVKTDGSDDGNRIYAAGFFTDANGAAAKNAAALLTAPGAGLATPTWAPVWSSTKSYQQAIQEIGNRVWVGGSEHSLFSYDTSTFNRLSGNIAKPNGDSQAITSKNGLIFAGCHCAGFEYENAYTWSALGTGWTRNDALKWFGIWDATTGARVPDFTPNLDMRQGNGIWTLKTDTLGNVWAGGDISTVHTPTGQKFSGGFARFPMVDSTPPGTPASFKMTSQTATTATFGWSTVTDASAVHYQILRDDRPIAFTGGNTGSITVPKGGSNRFFVRAVDSANNASASSGVVALGAADPLPNADFTSGTSRAVVSFDGSGSTAPVGSVTGYGWRFGDGTTGTDARPSHTYAAAGEHVVWLTVTTSNGASATISKIVTSNTAGQAAPTDAYGQEIYNQDAYAYYRLDEPSGTVAKDSGPDARTGTYTGTVTRGVAGALKNYQDAAIGLNGSAAGFVVSPKLTAVPGDFTAGIWFKTTSASGGRLIGYATSNTSTLSSIYDRMLFLQNDGTVVFGAYTNAQQRVTSPASYNDGQWHYAVGSLSGTGGMKLYLDGQVVGTNPNTVAQSYLGYWRVGTDSVWSGASSPTLNGSLDEAAVFAKVLTPAQVAKQWSLGGTVAPPNTPPTAAFTSSVSQLTADLDAGTSTDPDGPLSGYRWDFGDGQAASGQTVSHAYATGGDYTVRLTVTDGAAATDTVTHVVSPVTPPAARVVVDNGSAWRWSFAPGAPDPDWNQRTYDSSGWSSGAGVLGFGAPTVTTNIDTFAATSSRPVAAFFTKPFTVDTASQVVKMTIDSVADDGAVFYVNGTEVARQNMPTGTIAPGTYASTARKYTAANADPVVVDVPVGLLVDGTNVVSVESHLNYRGTPDVTFDLKATLTY